MIKKNSTDASGNPLYKKTTAIVKDAKCVTIYRRNMISYNCNLKLEYVVDNVTNTTFYNTSDKSHNVGDKIDIYYNSNNVSDIKLSNVPNKTTGSILLGIGGCFIILLILHIILMKKSAWYNRILCFNAMTSSFRSPMYDVAGISLMNM
jgi:hypothetical protein